MATGEKTGSDVVAPCGTEPTTSESMINARVSCGADAGM